MAGTAVTIRQEFPDGSQAERLRLAHNLLVDDIELLRARVNALCLKLDADAGVTDTNYTAGTFSSTNAISSASVLTSGKVNTFDG